ncbi:MAG: universal stress protein [Anaerolineales bacterium]
MFKNILVPLDGSKLAEAALAPAISFAQTLGAPLTLLHIIEQNAPSEVHSDRHLTRADEAEAYLQNLAQTAAENLSVQTHVHSAAVQNVAASIIEHANREFRPDLIAMCAHGSSGFRDLLVGSIAQQVLAGGEAPLLLLQPQTAEKQPFSLRRILIPLDSDSRHDEVFDFARSLARAYRAELYLLTVISTFETLSGREAAISSLLPATASALLDLQEENAREHLQHHLDEILTAGENCSAEIGRGDPVEVIAATAKRISADLILLGTHGKSGVKAFWARSVAPNVIKKTRIPLLLVPLKTSGVGER